MNVIKLAPRPEPTIADHVARALYAACVYNQVTKIEGADVDGERHRVAYVVPAFMYERMLATRPETTEATELTP